MVGARGWAHHPSTLGAELSAHRLHSGCIGLVYDTEPDPPPPHYMPQDRGHGLEALVLSTLTLGGLGKQKAPSPLGLLQCQVPQFVQDSWAFLGRQCLVRATGKGGQRAQTTQEAQHIWQQPLTNPDICRHTTSGFWMCFQWARSAPTPWVYPLTARIPEGIILNPDPRAVQTTCHWNP